jgi:hypothetical protein
MVCIIGVPEKVVLNQPTSSKAFFTQQTLTTLLRELTLFIKIIAIQAFGLPITHQDMWCLTYASILNFEASKLEMLFGKIRTQPSV